jgi:hypothetical protein
MIDTITVVFQDELSVLQVQAESISKYCSTDFVKNIYVVVNDDSDVDQLIDVAWWGKFSNCVHVLNRSTFGSSWYDNGWVSQQALKLQAGAQCSSPWSVVLDAKTLLVNNFDNKLFDHQNRVRSGSLQVYDVFLPSKHIVEQLFDINLDCQIGPGGVPFVFSTEVVQHLIRDVEQQTSQLFHQWFQDQGMLTEFLLYTGYAVKTGMISQYNLHDSYLTPVNICHSETGIWDIKIDQMKRSDISTVSVHRGAWSSVSDQQKQQYRDLLHSKQLTAEKLS